MRCNKVACQSACLMACVGALLIRDWLHQLELHTVTRSSKPKERANKKDKKKLLGSTRKSSDTSEGIKIEHRCSSPDFFALKIFTRHPTRSFFPAVSPRLGERISAAIAHHPPPELDFSRNPCVLHPRDSEIFAVKCWTQRWKYLSGASKKLHCSCIQYDLRTIEIDCEASTAPCRSMAVVYYATRIMTRATLPPPARYSVHTPEQAEPAGTRVESNGHRHASAGRGGPGRDRR